jgi:hypothetical protein
MATKKASAASAELNVGLFPVCFEIGGNMPGAPRFRVNLVVFTPVKTVHGAGHITQATNPPLNIHTILSGHYTYMTVMPNNTHILVTAMGHQIGGGGPGGPVMPPNVQLRMVLSKDWKSGTADYEYLGSNHQWHQVHQAPVKLVSCNPPQPITS